MFLGARGEGDERERVRRIEGTVFGKGQTITEQTCCCVITGD